MDDFSSVGELKTEEDSEKRLTREKEGKDNDRDQEEGKSSLYFSVFFTDLTLHIELVHHYNVQKLSGLKDYGMYPIQSSVWLHK